MRLLMIQLVLLCKQVVKYNSKNACLVSQALSLPSPPLPRGLSSMLNVVLIEIETWPDFLQIIFEYMQTATVVIPVIAVLG